MAKKTVISKVLDAEAVDGIIEFPQNKTLYMDQFTDKVTKENKGIFQPETIGQVFNHYKPEKKGVEMFDADGKSIKEDFKFETMRDFDEKNLVAQSKYLSTQNDKVASFQNIEQKLMRNRKLKKAFEDEDGRKNLVSALEALLAELQK